MSAQLVPIIVTDTVLQPDGSAPPTGTVQFQLTEEITGPQECAAKVVGANYSTGLLAQQLYANDLDSTGDPIAPATTMYRVQQDTDGAAPAEFFITVPAVPPGSRSVSDVVTEAGQQIISSATANFTDADLNAYVLLGNGSVVPPGTWIVEVISSTEVQLSQSPSAALTGVTIMVGASASLSELRPPA